MDDFDYYDYFSGDSYVSPGIPIQLPDITVFNPTDFSSIFDPTDISGLTGLDLSGVLDPTDISGLTNLDLSGIVDPTDISGLTGLDLSGVVDPTDISGLTDLSGITDPTDISEYLTSKDAEAQEGGFYGNTKNATYDPETNVTTIRGNDGTVIRQIPGPPIPTPPPGPGPGPGPKPPPGPGPDKTTTPPPGPSIPDWLKGLLPSKDNAMIYALLGGLLGLLNRGSGTKAPVGYQGSIPKYTAVRGKAESPRAGGRRPGGAGIGSLAGTTKYIPAAAGGLMGLAGGGRPARYLRGGTDGMADKIKTDIDGKQPARLSHGEFVIPADVVSHLGNGNSDAGADVLYDMMAKVRKARTGNSKQGKQINPRKYTPA